MILRLFLLSFFCSAPLNISAAEKDALVAEEFVYQPQENIVQLVQKKQSLAAQSKKLLMVVLGGQWCHDSRGLAKRFSHPEMINDLKQKYEIQFVDVGYLNSAFDVVDYLQIPIYWGTPSVYIIEPNSGRLLNRLTMWHWTNADMHEIDEYKAYFLNTDHRLAAEQLQALKGTDLLNQIERYEAIQAEKLKSAYRLLGPMLRDYKAQTISNTRAFNLAWEEVRDFRLSVNQNLISLYQSAIKIHQAKGSDLSLTIPSHPPFSWEVNAER